MPEVALLQPKLPSQSKRNVVLFFQGDFFSFFLLKNLVDLEFQFLGDLFWLAQLEARFHFLAFCFLYFLLLIWRFLRNRAIVEDAVRREQRTQDKLWQTREGVCERRRKIFPELWSYFSFPPKVQSVLPFLWKVSLFLCSKRIPSIPFLWKQNLHFSYVFPMFQTGTKVIPSKSMSTDNYYHHIDDSREERDNQLTSVS